MTLRRALPLVGTLTLVVVLGARIDLSAAFGSLRKLPLLIGLSAALIALTEECLVGPMKWRRVVALLGPKLSFREALLIRMGSQPIRIFAPLKSGEAAPVFYLNRVHGMPLDLATSTSLFEKAVNVWATVCLILVGLALESGLVLRFSALAAVALWVWLPFLGGPWRALSVALEQRFGRVGRFAGRALTTFGSLPARELAVQLPLALLFTGLEVFSAWLLLHGLGVSVSFGVVLIVVPLSYFLNNIPVFFLGIGMREAFFVTALTGLAGPATLLSAGLCVSFFEYILPTLVALLLLRTFLARLAAAPNTTP